MITKAIEAINELTRAHADNEEKDFCVAIPIEHLRALEEAWRTRNTSNTEFALVVLRDQITRVVEQIEIVADQKRLMREAIEPIVKLTGLLDSPNGGLFAKLPDGYDILSSEFTSGLPLSVFRDITRLAQCIDNSPNCGDDDGDKNGTGNTAQRLQGSDQKNSGLS